MSEDLARRLGADGKPLSALESLVQSAHGENGVTPPPVKPEEPGQSPLQLAPASELPANSSKPSEESCRGRDTPPVEPQTQEAQVHVDHSRSVPRAPRPTVREARPRPRALIEWHDPNEKETSDEEEYSSGSEIGVNIKLGTSRPIHRSDQQRPPQPRRRSTASISHRVFDVYPEDPWIGRRYRECYPTWSSPVYHPDPPKLTFFWACQIDIELGSWATPWKHGLFWDCIEALDMMVEICMTGIALCNRRAVLEQQVNQPVSYVRADTSESELKSAGIHFVSLPDDPTLQELWGHLRDGKHTWPPYAMNGHDGTLEPTPHQLIKFPTFPEDQTLPPLLLLRSVHHDLNGLNTHYSSHTRAVDRHLHLARDRLLELAALDHWLSHAGTTPAVLGSRVNLLGSTPGIIEEIWFMFHDSIMDVKREDKWSREGGGFEEMQRLATSINDWLNCELTTQGERVYVWIALLRAVKVMICVSEGPGTSNVSELFDDDILVYLV